ncbi:glycosyltransferase [Caldimonas thermodepolymerans]|jgi:Glycosyltransferase|uniref:glycosyltransferase n=1 Tax=Caldimonas thermodepolymerans TaxID=215580 RepID=UPI0022357386|nr:glycosyltransferase [Caldimonas thermodepolymerans]UZG46258.1 glycosyltransferase [Caldimonas thermodepolymerans]
MLRTVDAAAEAVAQPAPEPAWAGSAGGRTRVLFVLPELKGGGAQRVALALLSELDRNRYDVGLLVLGGDGYELSSAVPADVRLHYPPRALKLLGSWGGRLYTAWLGRRYDVLVAALEMRATFCTHFAARLLRKPAVLWVHIAFDRWAVGLSRKHARRCRTAYRDIPHVVFVSDRAREGMQHWLGHGGAGWRTIPNMFSAEAYARAAGTVPQGPAGAVLARMRSRPAVIGIGRLEERKGFDLLVAAAGRLAARGLDFDLVILGEGKLRNALVEQARREGIAERVFMPGYVPNPLDWLKAASVYVLSSRVEGLPTTIIEAMTVGTPVVATDCPAGPRELLKDGTVGLLVPMDDVDAITDAVEQLLRSDELRRQCITAGHERARDFAPERVLQQWDAVIGDALAAGSR